MWRETLDLRDICDLDPNQRMETLKERNTFLGSHLTYISIDLFKV